MAWEPAEHAGDVLDAAVAVATFAADSPGLDGRPGVRRELLRLYVLSLVTQGTLPGKGRTRYVSDGALAASGDDRLEHEHVYTRSYLADLVIENPRENAVRWILANLAFAATVTKSEHAQLTRVSKDVEGWDRYLSARVGVMDLATGLKVTASPEIPSWIRQPGGSDPTKWVRLPGDAVDRLLASEALRDLLDPELGDLPGAPGWSIRRAEAFDCLGIVARAAGHRFPSADAAKEDLFSHADGGGFGIRRWMEDAVLALLEPVAPR